MEIEATKITADCIESSKILVVENGDLAWAEPPKNHPTNCTNCGATLHGNVCEYCGTEY